MSSPRSSDRLAIAVMVGSFVLVFAIPAAVMIGATLLLLEQTELPLWVLIVSMPVVYLLTTWAALSGAFRLLDQMRRPGRRPNDGPLSDGEVHAEHPPPDPPTAR